MKKFICSVSKPALCLVLLLASACSSSSSSSSTTSTTTSALTGLASCTAQSGSAVICGTVYAADGTTPVANATISLVTSSALVKGLTGLTYGDSGELTANSSACLTDDAGAYACQVSETGSKTFQVSGSIFSSALSFTASLTTGSVTNVATSDTTATSAQVSGTKWLVVQGAYDGIQALLAQIKGCTLTGDSSDPASLSSSTSCENAGLTVLSESDAQTRLSNATLSTYQAIFANCASDLGSDSTVTSKLQTYVNNGGNMYFSDLSDSWLTAVFPGLITFPSDKNSTDSGTLTGMTVSDSGLATFLGASTMSITFDFGVWTAMGSVAASGWTTYIQGNVSPLASSLTGTRPITVGGPKGSGCIFYTSYHVEGGSSGAAQERALKYLVLNRMSNCD